MTALALLLALFLLGARAQHSSKWTYSGKPPPQGLHLSSVPSPAGAAPPAYGEHTELRPLIETRGVRAPFPDPLLLQQVFLL